MFHIQHVEIEGFWGKHKVSADLNRDVNVFIGKNGTGKTTFMNLLQGVLQVDIPTLVSFEFSKITIKLQDKNRTRTIKVEREDKVEEPFESVMFRVGARAFKLQIFERDLEMRRMIRLRPRVAEQLENLKTEIQNLVNVSSLSVHRATYAAAYEDDYPRKAAAPKSPIDQRLEELMQQLTTYQLSLELQARKISSQFQKNVLASILYDKQFDEWDIEEIESAELTKEKQELLKAYRELGALDEAITKKINTHIEALTKSLKAIKNRNAPNNSLDINDVMPLPLWRRTQHIIYLTRKAEEEKQAIFRPIKSFVDAIVGFVSDKQFRFGAAGNLEIFKDNKQIPLSKLSSGEKQLLILLTETILQRNQPFIFLADEPELSLHIEWQAKIISSIRLLNNLAQIIVATHSPEIAGGWKRNLIDMEDIIGG